MNKKLSKLALGVTAALTIGGATFAIEANAAGDQVTKPDSSFTDLLGNVKEEKRQLRNLNVQGYYRLYTFHRNYSTPYYEALAINPREFLVGDGYRAPMLLAKLSGKPHKKSYWELETFWLPDYVGAGYADELSSNINSGFGLELGATLRGVIRNDAGRFDIQMGGLNWKQMSPLTLHSNELYNRVSIFEREPWDNSVDALGRYTDFYSQGAVNRDNRWGNRPFMGLFIEADKLPGKTSAIILVGKTDNNGGTKAYEYPGYPDYVWGGQVKKALKKNYLAYNTFNRVGNFDNVNSSQMYVSSHTLEYLYNIKGIGFSGEIGAGSYGDPENPVEWSEGIHTAFKFPKKYTFIPIELRYYYLGENFVNSNNGMFSNTSRLTAQKRPIAGGGVASVQTNSRNNDPVVSPVQQVGGMANNRRGLYLNTDFDVLKKLKVAIGYGVASEITPLSNGFSIVHRVNQLALSRTSQQAMFQQNYGPYNRYTYGFRSAFQIVRQTDVDSITGLPTSNKHFSNLEGQLKYQQKIFNRTLSAFYLGQIATAQPNFSLLNMSEENYISQVSHEIELYYNILPQWHISFYYGNEHIKGGIYSQPNNTEEGTAYDGSLVDVNPSPFVTEYQTLVYTEEQQALDIEALNNGELSQVDFDALPTLDPMDLLNKGIGFGIDYDMGKAATIAVRHRWVSLNDASYRQDNLKGTETTVELKYTFW